MTGLVLTRPKRGSGGSVPGSLELSIINLQPIITYVDSTRGVGTPPAGKRLSVSEHTLTWAEPNLTSNDWIQIGNANDAESGYAMDLDGTVVFATAQCENVNDNAKDIHIFINNTDAGSIGTLGGGSPAVGEEIFVNTTLDLDFNQGDKIRLQAQQIEGAAILDTVVKITVRWRA